MRCRRPSLGLRANLVVREAGGLVRLPESAVAATAEATADGEPRWVAGAELAVPAEHGRMRITYPASADGRWPAGALEIGLFDYVEVALHVTPTSAHLPTVTLDLRRKLGGRPADAGGARGKVTLAALQATEAQEAAQSAAAAAAVDAADRARYAQTSADRSLYAVLERMRLLTLADTGGDA